MNWWRRLLRLPDRDAEQREHVELIEVRQHYHRSLVRSQRVLAELQPHIEREARRVEQLLRSRG